MCPYRGASLKRRSSPKPQNMSREEKLLGIDRVDYS